MPGDVSTASPSALEVVSFLGKTVGAGAALTAAVYLLRKVCLIMAWKSGGASHAELVNNLRSKSACLFVHFLLRGCRVASTGVLFEKQSSLTAGRYLSVSRLLSYVGSAVDLALPLHSFTTSHVRAAERVHTNVKAMPDGHKTLYLFFSRAIYGLHLLRYNGTISLMCVTQGAVASDSSS